MKNIEEDNLLQELEKNRINKIIAITEGHYQEAAECP